MNFSILVEVNRQPYHVAGVLLEEPGLSLSAFLLELDERFGEIWIKALQDEVDRMEDCLDGGISKEFLKGILVLLKFRVLGHDGWLMLQRRQGNKTCCKRKRNTCIMAYWVPQAKVGLRVFEEWRACGLLVILTKLGVAFDPVAEQLSRFFCLVLYHILLI
jgi:hypothetical protein